MERSAATAVKSVDGVVDAAKVNRGIGGFLRTTDGKLKVGNIAKTAAYTGGAGFLGWTLLDPGAGSKIGGAANNLGGAVGGLFGGLGSGLLGAFLRPEFMLSSCSSCLSICMVLVFFLMRH